MKLRPIFVCVVLAAVARADLPLFSLPARIPMPPLSLSDIAKSAAPGMGPSYPGESWMHQIGARLAPMAPRLQSQMPILKPKATIDAKMVIKPDERIDYKLIIKRPNVAPPEDKRHHK